MSKEKIQELRLRYLDLFKNDNSKFELACNDLEYYVDFSNDSDYTIYKNGV